MPGPERLIKTADKKAEADRLDKRPPDKAGRTTVQPGHAQNDYIFGTFAPVEDRPPLLASWVGITPLRETRTSSDHQDHDIGGDQLAIDEEAAFALQGDLEVGSDAVFAIRRHMRFDLAKTFSADVETVSRAHLMADRVPRDIAMAVETPTKLGSTNAEIYFHAFGYEGETFRYRSHHSDGRPLAEALRDDRLLAFDTQPGERIAALRAQHADARLGDIYDDWLDALEPRIAALCAALDAHTAAVRNYEDGTPQVLDIADEWLTSLAGQHEVMVSNYQRGGRLTPEGTLDLARIRRLERLQSRLYAAYSRAFDAEAPEKSLLDHAKDFALAPVHAVGAAAGGIVELGKMAADLGRLIADRTLNVFGLDFSWDAYSAVGKAYEQGKSTSEILLGMWEGFCAELATAIEHARNGDFSKLFDFNAGLALDAALAVATVGSAPAASWSARAGRIAETMGDAAKRLAALARAVAADARLAAKEAGIATQRWAREALSAAAKFLEGDLVPALAGVVRGDISGVPGLRSGLALLRSRTLAEAGGELLQALKKRGIGRGARALDLPALVRRLRTLAGDAAAERRIRKVFDALERADRPAAYARAIDRVLDLRRRVDPDVLARVLERSARLGEGQARFLDDLADLADRRISREARTNLLDKAARGEAPDPGWLSRLDLSDSWLDYLGSNDATNWKTFMKVSTEMSDMFPTALSKRNVAINDLIDAAAKARGVAAELVVKDAKLGPFQITQQQVDVLGKILDFGGEVGGEAALLEVKGWSARRWRAQLAARGTGIGEEALLSLQRQLDAAKASGKPTYLAVTDALDDVTRDALAQWLTALEYDAHVIYFSEAKLKGTVAKLRRAMALPAMVAVLAAMDVDDE